MEIPLLMINNHEILGPSKLSAAYHYLSGGYLSYIQSTLRQQRQQSFRVTKQKIQAKEITCTYTSTLIHGRKTMTRKSTKQQVIYLY